MTLDSSELSILKRREIEAQIVGSLLAAFQNEIGPEKTLSIAQKVIENLAFTNGQELAKLLGGNTLEDFAKGLSLWGREGALEVKEIKQNEKELSFNVTKCKYADMYETFGLKEYGVLLSCNRDYSLVKGFNPSLKLVRTQTIMEGGSKCDFCIVKTE